MYSRFIFGDFKEKDLKGKELHKFCAFFDAFSSKSRKLSELAWLSKLRIHQALLKSKQEHDSTHMTIGQLQKLVLNYLTGRLVFGLTIDTSSMIH